MLFILNKKLEVADTLSNQGENSSITPFFEDEYKQYLGTGAETFSFQTLANTRESQHLVVGNYVAFRYDDKYKLFHITQIEEEHTEEFVKSVYCEMAGIELINDVVRPVNFSGNLRKFLTMVLADTEWEVGKIDGSFTDIHDIEIKDYSTAYGLIQEYVTETFGGEVELVVNITNGSVVSKQVNVYVTRGNDNGFRFSYSSNISSIKRTVDTSELCTALIGVGKNNITFKEVETGDKPLNQDFIVSESAYKQWSKNGSHIMGIANFDTESPHELLRLTREELEKRIEPKVKYELSTELITGDEVKIGDTVYVVDLEFNPPIQLQARVSELTISFTDKSRNECVLSNFVEVNSNITKEMRKMASQLEGYVDTSINSQYPLSGEKISENAIKSTHIQQNTISADHIQAGQINADHIEANSINAGHIQANQIQAKHIEAKQIKADHIDAGQIKSEHIEAGTLDAKVINADTVNADLIKGVVVDAINLYAQSADIDKAMIDSAVIDSGQIAELVAKNLKVSNAQITDLEAGKIKAGDLIADVMKTNAITAINMNATNAVIDSAKIGKLTADHIDSIDIKTESLTANVIDAINASISNATIDSAKIGTISADKIEGGEIKANILKSNIIEAINASIENATIDNAKIGNITADKIVGNQIDTNILKSNIIEAINASISTATIDSAKIGTITADKIKGGDISADTMTANVISAINAYVGEIKIKQAQMEAIVVGSANITDLEATKIKGGTLDCSNITVKHLNAESLVVGSINGKHIANGAISGDKLDEVLSGVITDTSSKATDALEQAGLAKQEVDDVKIIVNGKSRIIYSPTQPTGEYSESDVWFDTANGHKMHKYTNGLWVATQFGNGALMAESITGSTVSGDNFIAGTIKAGSITTNDIMARTITAENILSKTITASEINTDSLFADEAFIRDLQAQKIKASSIEVDEIRNDLIDIKGLVTFDALADDLEDFLLFPSYSLDENGNKVYDKTYINGGNIYTGSIKADKIDLLSGINVQGADGQTTFAISDDGQVNVNGILQSGNYLADESGYSLTPDGNVEINQAKIRGDIYLPNAGMTNYGGQFGNENLVKNSDFKNDTNWVATIGSSTVDVAITNNGYYANALLLERTGQVAGVDRLFVYQQLDGTSFVADTDVTLSFWIYIDETIELTQGNNNVGIRWYSEDKSILGESPSVNMNNLPVGKWEYVQATAKVPSTFLQSGYARVFGALYLNGSVRISKVKVELSDSATTWCPSKDEQANHVRIWAGSTFEDRENAPFKVMQDGSLFAKDGTFSGSLYGDYDNGKIHLHDDEIVINSTITTMGVNGEESITPYHYNENPYIRFGEGISLINTDLIFGTVDDSRVYYSNDERKVDINIATQFNTSKGNMIFNKATEDMYYAIGFNSVNGGAHEIKYSDSSNGLLFSSSGNNTGDSSFDFIFERTQDEEDVFVDIQGELNVKTAITSSGSDIEMRVVANEGWGFYVS